MWYYFCIFFAALVLIDIVNLRTEHTASEPKSIFYKKNSFDKNMFTKYYFYLQKKTNFISALGKIHIQILNSQHTLQNIPHKTF